MYIRSISLQGFKSFPDKVTVDLTAGIAAVVGPNGCGKSNILDAMRWCFGSQSPKALRGGSMQDVIFAGTSRRPAMGFAEVCVTFSNEDKKAPGEWRDVAEISISRRIDRDGDGEYRLNNARVRLKDVQEFLMDAGYGEYSIVQQGSIGELVRAKPDDVRRFIEQASRMTKYRARREEAKNKLERTEENLERVLDLLQEIERQMNSLKRQADKARKAIEIEQELAGVAAVVLDRRLKSVVTEEGEHTDAIKEIDGTIGEVRTRIAAQEAEQEDIHLKQAGAEQEFQQVLARQRELQDTRAELTSRLSALTNEQEYRAQERNNAADERKILENEVARLSADLDTLGPELDRLQHSYNEFLQGAEGTDQRARDLAARREALRSDIDNLRGELYAQLQSQVDLRSSVNEAQLTLQHANDRIQSLDEESKDARDLMASEETRVNEVKARLSDARSASEQAATRHQQLLEQITETRRGLESSQAALSDATRLRQDLTIEQDKLASVLGSGEAVASLPGLAPEAIQMPWNRVSPVAGQEDLVETILADRLHAVLVSDQSVATSILEALRGAAGEQRMAWLNLGHGGSPGESVPAGMVPVRTLLNYSGDDARWIEILTAGVFVTDAPLQPGADLPGGDWHVIWDRTGTSVNRLGVWSAGPLASSGTAHLAARKEEIGSELEQTSIRIDQLKKDISGLERSLAEQLGQREDAARILETAQRETAELENELEIVNKNRARFEQMVLQFEDEQSRLEADKGKAHSGLEGAEQALADAQANIDQLQQKIAANEAELVPLVEQERELEAERSSQRAQAEELRNAVVEKQRQRDSITERMTSTTNRLTQLEGQITFAFNREDEIEKELKVLQEQIDETNKAAFEVGAQLESMQSRQTEIRNRQIELEKDLRGNNQQLDKALQNRAQLEQRLQDIRHERESAIDHYEQRFGQPWNAPAEPDERDNAELQELHDTLVRRRDRLGAINPAAVEEYDEIRQRFEQMSTQREDLLKSIESLRSSIRKMNKESRDRFQSAFESVNQHFGEIFAKLFRGGHAELQLTDPEDWLESGVEIVAQPPGTNLQRLELLSGGQSAMTAFSLILAIFMTHPSPFCVLDEVDAPLDDANIARFNQVIIELNELAQIILITHNKQTMEIAENLFGVTMEERGVSKAIPVRLT